jgi:hypothetical protein
MTVSVAVRPADEALRSVDVHDAFDSFHCRISHTNRTECTSVLSVLFFSVSETWYRDALRAKGALAITRPRFDAASRQLLVRRIPPSSLPVVLLL